MCTLYKNILELCEARSVKPGKLCDDLNISRSLMSDLKHGRKQSVRVETAQKIADYFGVTVDRVLGNEQKNKPTTEIGDELYPGADSLTEENKAKVREYIQLLLNAQRSE